MAFNFTARRTNHVAGAFLTAQFGGGTFETSHRGFIGTHAVLYLKGTVSALECVLFRVYILVRAVTPQ